jgi:hypothetical protein
MTASLLISTSDIAELVEERLPVVSTWRSRFKDGENAFPEPVAGTPSRPLFEFDEVREWVSRNRPEKRLDSKLLPVRLWSEVRRLTDSGHGQFDVVCWLHGLLYKRKLELGGSSAKPPVGSSNVALLSSLASGSVPNSVGDSAWSLLAQASAPQLISASDFLLHRLGASQGRSGGDIGGVASNISGILAQAATAFATTAPRNPVVYDGALGLGEAVIAIELLGRFKGHLQVIGTEINGRVAALAAVRLALRDLVSEIRTADGLSTWNFPDVSPDLVVTEPPFGLRWAGVWESDDPRARFGVPPARNADLAWVADAVTRLEGPAQALVLTTMGALSRGGAEERIRASLVRSGAVEAVLALPANLLQYTSLPLALWVLRAPEADDPNRVVRVLDASEPELDDFNASKRADWVRENIALWVIDPLAVDPNDGVSSAIVHLNELQDAGMDLTPSRWGSLAGSSGVREHLFGLSMLFADAVAPLHRDFPAVEELPSAQHVVTVREMTETSDSKEAKLWTGRGVSNDAAAPDTVTSQDLKSGVLRPGESGTAPASGFWSRAGDVLFTTMGRVRALVDTTGGHRIGNGVHALRLEQPSRFDPEYVALCLSARWNDRHQKGTTIKHAKPGDLEIPLLTREDQHRWLSSLRELSSARQRAQEIVELADDLEIAAQNALRFGWEDDE